MQADGGDAGSQVLLGLCCGSPDIMPSASFPCASPMFLYLEYGDKSQHFGDELWGWIRRTSRHDAFAYGAVAAWVETL